MKPSIPKGTRDFSPIEMVKRNYIFDTIRDVFKKFGFLPIETPSMENSATLMGKYGEEGDKLIFKILNSGDFLKDADQELLANKDSKKVTSSISEKALKYDLTVPFARYVVMHQNEITFPFKRYQIQPVWRADRPQKGRYREFYQCDADVIGSNSLLNEVELIMLIDEVFTKLGLGVKIKINNRKILAGIAEYIGEKDRVLDIAIAIDKIDKTSIENVMQELSEKGFSDESIKELKDFLFVATNSVVNVDENLNQKHSEFYLSFLDKKYFTIKNIQDGVNEMKLIFDTIRPFENIHKKVEVDFSLARGLNYYTGAIFEVKVEDERSSFTSSICGGGRYDDLTGIFGLPNMSGVGISFGADRIYDVLEEANLFPETTTETTKVLILNYGESNLFSSLKIAKSLRDAGVNTELYPDYEKEENIMKRDKHIAKQINYADKRGIQYIIKTKWDEFGESSIILKDIQKGIENPIQISDLAAYIQNNN